MRTEELKFIWDNKRPDQPDLYVLTSDPDEKQPASAQYPQEVARFQALVETHLQQVAQTQPLTVTAQPEFDEEIARRLRGLGYIE
jgi:hypothetical protein